MGNNRTITQCDFCKQDVVLSSVFEQKKGTGAGYDILRPFNPSFEAFLGANPKIPMPCGDIEICKTCAKKMALYVNNVIKPEKIAV